MHRTFENTPMVVSLNDRSCTDGVIFFRSGAPKKLGHICFVSKQVDPTAGWRRCVTSSFCENDGILPHTSF